MESSRGLGQGSAGRAGRGRGQAQGAQVCRAPEGLPACRCKSRCKGTRSDGAAQHAAFRPLTVRPGCCEHSRPGSGPSWPARTALYNKGARTVVQL